MCQRQPLSFRHGPPLALRWENQLGYKMVKWVGATEFGADLAHLGAGKVATTETMCCMAELSTAASRRPFFTIGHSTRSVEEVADLLRAVGADMIVDVRKMPRSRANPQFNLDVLPDALGERRIGYHHIASLGGLRGRQASAEVTPNTLWRNRSFRNYADYALTPPFKEGLAKLIAQGRERTCAIMCAEVLWWRCHRRIIADYLLAGGETVFHILSLHDVKPAGITPGAELTPEGLLYQQPSCLSLGREDPP